MNSNNYFGIYRGTVLAINDPANEGRIRVIVPDVFGHSLNVWAMPCFPFGSEETKKNSVPPGDSNVWVLLESGDPNFPVCIGYR